MSDDKAQQEPSMEDILASIRRILSEDEAEDKKAPPPAPEPEPEPVAMPEPDPEPDPEPAMAMPQDDIDSLFAAPPPMAVREPEPEPEDDVLELTEDMVLEEAEPEPEPEPEPLPEPEPVPAFDLNDFKYDTDPYEAEPPPVLAAAARVSARLDDDEDLVSPPASGRSTSALSELARAVARERAIALGNGGITLEDMVREILKPILSDWLDQNLPYMIERIVKKEIEKMVNRAENY
jgi:uncharacterized protein